jgi:hypothetical protein
MVVVDLKTILIYLTLISIPVVVIYHIVTIRNQSRTRQRNSINIYNQSFSSPPYQKAIAKVFNTPWDSYENFIKIYHGERNMMKTLLQAMT